MKSEFVKIAFGYDSIFVDCEVLKVTCKRRGSDAAVRIMQVYTSNANSWRQLQAPILTNWSGRTTGKIMLL